MRPTKEIDAAIKLLQSQGYEVFQRSAACIVEASESLRADMFLACENDPEFKQHVARKLAHRVGLELMQAGVLATVERTVAGDDRLLPSYRVQTLTSFELFPASRKEWARA